MGLQMWAFEPTPKLLLQMWLEMGQDTASDSIQCREVAGSTRQSSAENRDSASQEPKSSARKSSQAQPEYRPGTCFETTSGTQDGVTHAHGKGWATRRMAIFAVACVTVCVCVMLVWSSLCPAPVAVAKTGVARDASPSRPLRASPAASSAGIVVFGAASPSVQVIAVPNAFGRQQNRQAREASQKVGGHYSTIPPSMVHICPADSRQVFARPEILPRGRSASSNGFAASTVRASATKASHLSVSQPDFGARSLFLCCCVPSEWHGSGCRAASSVDVAWCVGFSFRSSPFYGFLVGCSSGCGSSSSCQPACQGFSPATFSASFISCHPWTSIGTSWIPVCSDAPGCQPYVCQWTFSSCSFAWWTSLRWISLWWTSVRAWPLRFPVCVSCCFPSPSCHSSFRSGGTRGKHRKCTKALPRDSKHGSNFHTAVSASASFGFRWRNIYAVAAGWIHGCTGHQSGATCNGYASFTCCPCFAPTSPASTCPWLRAMPSCERSRVAIFGKPGSGSEGYAATRYGVVQAVSIIPASRSPRFCRCPCASFVPCVCEPSRRNTGSRCSVHFQFSGKACVPASEIAQSEQGLRGFCAYPARGSFSRAWRNGHPARHTITSPDAGADRNSFAARGGFDSFGIAAGPGEAPSGGVSETVCASTLDFVEGVCPGTVRRPCVGLSPCSHVLPASKPRALSLSELLQPVGFEQSKLWSLHDCVRSCMQPSGVPFLRQDRELFHLLPDLSRDLLVLIEQVPTWNQEPVIKAFVYTDGSSACSQPATWAMVVVYQCSDVGSGCCCWRFRGFAFATVTQHEQWIRRGPNVGEQIHDALTAEAVGLIWAMVWSLQCDEFLDCCFCFDAQSVGFHAAGFWSWTSSMYYDQLSASLSALRALLHTVKSSVCWMHEPAHAGHPWNELCDALAKACCKGVLFPLVLPLELPNLVRHSYCAHAWLTLADRRHDLPTPAAWPALFRLEGPLPLPYRMPPGILRPRHLVLSLKSVLL